jgi:acyl-CoA synthetase (AMP-forming)/AMP-acid ligase II
MQVVLTALVTGACLIIPASRRVQSLWEAASVYSATHMSGTPTFWRSFLMLCSSQEALPHLRQITLGGEAVDQKTLDRLRMAFPQARITHIYASTEAGALFSVDDGRAGFPASWLDQAVSSVRLRIEDGELQVWSPRRMEGYASMHDSPFLDDGWLRTGDLVRLEGERVQFAGRKDTTINVGGMKVQPVEVEGALLEVEGVVEARVSSVRNPITGQLVVAEIVVEPGRDAQQVKQAAAAHVQGSLASYKVPRSIRVVDSIATSQAGKKLNAAISA